MANLFLMDAAGLPALVEAIRHMHGLEATWVESVPVHETHNGATVYASVSRFRLDDLKPYIYRTHDSGKTWQKIVNGLPENASVNAVREDPERRGLLFAATERQVWVSLDDGDRWQSLRLNMPATSVRDLVIHEDDLVIGTHGRSFWILDNITPLRQLDQRVAGAPAHLFRPQLARRVRWNTYTDTPLPPEEPAGKNPPDGAILDYALAAAAAGPVTLEILDASGKMIRRFSSADKPEPVDEKEMNVPTYWVRPARFSPARRASTGSSGTCACRRRTPSPTTIRFRRFSATRCASPWGPGSSPAATRCD